MTCCKITAVQPVDMFRKRTMEMRTFRRALAASFMKSLAISPLF
jgi:hypothetical protein